MRRLLTRWMVLTLLAMTIGSVEAAAQGRMELRRERPAALVPLYLTFAGLQAVDVHSTMSALGNGARESNPVMRSALGSPTQMFLLKSGTAAGVMLLSEKLWRHNRAAAVITMVMLNSAYATIAAHNYRTSLRR
ncbi:MAG TPA: DUF5658 family protein [Steroidobacteraceae bacterium]|nr:DUF5658 family protein [Steroidobacteraceae bacterium]